MPIVDVLFTYHARGIPPRHRLDQGKTLRAGAPVMLREADPGSMPVALRWSAQGASGEYRTAGGRLLAPVHRTAGPFGVHEPVPLDAALGAAERGEASTANPFRPFVVGEGVEALRAYLASNEGYRGPRLNRTTEGYALGLGTEEDMQGWRNLTLERAEVERLLNAHASRLRVADGLVWGTASAPRLAAVKDKQGLPHVVLDFDLNAELPPESLFRLDEAWRAVEWVRDRYGRDPESVAEVEVLDPVALGPGYDGFALAQAARRLHDDASFNLLSSCTADEAAAFIAFRDAFRGEQERASAEGRVFEHVKTDAYSGRTRVRTPEAGAGTAEALRGYLGTLAARPDAPFQRRYAEGLAAARHAVARWERASEPEPAAGPRP